MILITIDTTGTQSKCPGNGFELQMRGPGTAATQGASHTKGVQGLPKVARSQLSLIPRGPATGAIETSIAVLGNETIV